MADQASPQTEFADVVVVEAPEPVISYRSALTVYQESLTRGQWVGRNWSGCGYVNYAGYRGCAYWSGNCAHVRTAGG